MKKKLIFLTVCAVTSALFAGCSAESVAERYLPHPEKEDTDTAEVKERVYMDKITGTLLDFDGTLVTVTDSESTYTFDASEATLECAAGMIVGDEVSVIYEGVPEGTDTSNVKVLKVVDELHTKKPLEEQTVHGTLAGMTANTVTFRDDNGQTYRFTSVGARQYYTAGIAKDLPVYIHYLGTLPNADPESAEPSEAPLVKILSISDADPFAAPNLSKIVPQVALPEEETPEETVEAAEAAGETAADAEAAAQKRAKEAQKPLTAYDKVRGELQSEELGNIYFVPSGASEAVSLDLSHIPGYFPGGTAAGTDVSFYYYGERQDTVSLAGVSVLFAVGTDPADVRPDKVSSYVSGTVVGRTADTVTIRTADNARVTVRSADASSFEPGAEATLRINPALTGNSDIYK